MRHVRSTKLNRSSGKQATCWTNVDTSQNNEFITELVECPPPQSPKSCPCGSVTPESDRQEIKLGSGAIEQDGQCLSNAQPKTSKKNYMALGTVHALLNPPTEDQWKQLSPGGDLADDLKWTMRCTVREDKHAEGAQTVTGFPCDGHAGYLRPHLQAAPPATPLPSPQEVMGRNLYP